MSLPDRRLRPFRADLAASHLRETIAAPRYVDGVIAHVISPSALLLCAPEPHAAVGSELLFGEQVTVYEDAQGWSWVQNGTDRYVGYVPSAALAPGRQKLTHHVRVPRTAIYAQPTIKKGERGLISMNAAVAVDRLEGEFAVLADGAGFVFAAHLAPLGAHARDTVDVALQFLHAPYRWGGRTSLGLDCSGLVQMALMACGIDCPRDTDMQETTLGVAVEPDLARLKRGDLVFWKGHVGIVSAPGNLLHATGHFMLVVEEPLHQAVTRIAGQGLSVTSLKRL